MYFLLCRKMSNLKEIVDTIFSEMSPTIMAEMKAQDIQALGDVKCLLSSDLEQVLEKLSGSVVKKAKLREALVPHIKQNVAGDPVSLFLLLLLLPLLPTNAALQLLTTKNYHNSTTTMTTTIHALLACVSSLFCSLLFSSLFCFLFVFYHVIRW